jgi:quercetin dioxygenase-like cupin family protein
VNLEVKQMNRRGQVFENPVSGERVVILTDPADHPEQVLVVHLFVRPGGRVAAPHVHPTITERFYVLNGQVGFLIGGDQRVLAAGEVAEVPSHTTHDWWQVGDKEAEVIVEINPGDRFMEMVASIFGLARDGKTDRRGLPHLLQLAVMVDTYRDVMIMASPPPALQRLIFGLLSRPGRWLGRQASYPQYLSSDHMVEPDPTALSLLTPEGRLRLDAGREAM